jgi:cupin 2 domain-containing protein
MRRPTVTNLLASLTVRPESELFEPIASTDQFLFERILSFGHATPPGKWFDQPRDEWVMLLSGAARLRFEGHDDALELRPGDALLIPAHCRHRVEWTRPDGETIWLALHFRRGNVEPPTN